MLTVKEAAEQLGVTQARVRKMIYDGVMPAEGFGNRWSIPEAAVVRRSAEKPKSGRPKKNAPEKDLYKGTVTVAQHLYQECKDNLSHIYDIDMLLQLATPEEREFCIVIADFFLRQKQRQLIDDGVF